MPSVGQGSSSAVNKFNPTGMGGLYVGNEPVRKRSSMTGMIGKATSQPKASGPMNNNPSGTLNYLQQIDNFKQGEPPLRPELVINEKLKQVLPAMMYSNSTGKNSSVTGKKSLNWLNEREAGDSLT